MSKFKYVKKYDFDSNFNRNLAPTSAAEKKSHIYYSKFGYDFS